MAELPERIRRALSNGLEIRRAEGADLAAILQLLSQMHDEDSSLAVSPRSRSAYERMLSQPGRAILVATIERRVAGTLDLFVLDNLTRDTRPWAGIENIVVDVDYRRRGIGLMLMRVALDLASEAGCYKVQLISHSRRDAAHELYSKLGFDAPVKGYRHYLIAPTHPA